MKKTSIYILIILILVIYRAEIFNLVVDYESQKEIPTVELTEDYWIKELDKISNSNNGFIENNHEILNLISDKLSFGQNQIIKNPNDFRKSKAHCVGYASLQAALLTHLLKDSDYKITHQRGKIKLLGIDLTKISKSTFYSDHDFIKIENLQTGEFYYSDASLYEFLRISRIK